MILIGLIPPMGLGLFQAMAVSTRFVPSIIGVRRGFPSVSSRLTPAYVVVQLREVRQLHFTGNPPSRVKSEFESSMKWLENESNLGCEAVFGGEKYSSSRHQNQHDFISPTDGIDFEVHHIQIKICNCTEAIIQLSLEIPYALYDSLSCQEKEAGKNDAFNCCPL